MWDNSLEARKRKEAFDNAINKDKGWICHNDVKPKAYKPCFVLVFEVAPFIGLEYQIRVAIYDPKADTYIDVINGLTMAIDSPVCTFWKYTKEK